MSNSSEPTGRAERAEALYFKGHISRDAYERRLEHLRGELRSQLSAHRPPAVMGRKRFVGTLAYKSIDAAIKADDEAGTFDLYAAVFNNVDRQGDLIEPGAFSNLDEFTADGVGLVNHGMGDLPVAWIDSATQDSKGLLIRGRFHSTPQAQHCRTIVRERLAAGKGVKCSIGYQVDDPRPAKTRPPGVIRIKSLRVYEFSFVNIPANPLAGVVSA